MLRAYLELLRPANVATALADVLAGFAVGGLQNRPALPWLLLSTACLYAGGIVLNDFFDRGVDRLERPERPIPSGRVGAPSAAILGGALLAAGWMAASHHATREAGRVALAIVIAVLVYNAWGKRILVIGPLNMGLCRALNLMLGVAAVPAALPEAWPLALIPLSYIAAVTMVSRGEVHGGGRGMVSVALIFLGAALLGLLTVAFRAEARMLVPALVLSAALIWRVVPPFVTARKAPAPGTIRLAVRRGVLSLVILDATIGAAYAGPVYAALILATGLAAGALARWFAVT
jgi:4-hydroxybenzoate polyprenyltransferase